MKIFHFTLLLANFFPNPGSPPLVCASTGLQDSTGIRGTVYEVSGNRMPSPDIKSGSGRLNGVRSTIYVFELTGIGQAVRLGQTPCYTAVNTKLVRLADTDENGHFDVLLPPGRYSVFTRKGELFCAGRRDDKNNIAPVEVLPGKMTRVDCRVESDHKPVY